MNRPIAQCRSRIAAILAIACLGLAGEGVPHAPAQPPPDRPASPTVSRAVLIKADGGGAGRPTLALLAAEESDDSQVRIMANRGIVAREVFRQALLIAARDGLGMATRDATLGDKTAAEKGDAIAELATRLLDHDSAKVAIRRVGNAGAPLFAEDFALGKDGPLDLTELVRRAETYSRGAFVDALKKAGASGKPVAADPDGPASKGVDELLDQISPFAQFAALRMTHEAIRTKGESPRRLGALVRAYAQLGVLAESQWEGSSKAYKARALLYGQRMAAQAPKSSWALRHRAFAEALVGLHAAALADLSAADKLAGNAGGKKPSTETPGWVALIAAACRFDARGVPTPGDDRHAQLAALLRYQAVEHSFSKNLTIDAAKAGLDLNPECYRLWDALCEEGGVSIQHMATEGSFQALSESLSGRLGEMPGLPAGVAALLPKNDEVGEARGLIEAGAPGVDGGEPSWAVLGHMIREIRFVQAWRRLRFMRDIWSVPVDDFLAEAKPLVADHPYRKFIESYGLDYRSQLPAIRALVKGIVPRDLEQVQYVMSFEIAQANPQTGVRYHDQLRGHRDAVARDLAAYVGAPDSAGWKDAAHDLLKISPNSPAAMACLIREDWPFAAPLVDSWRKSTGDHPQLLRALANRHEAANELDDAVRELEAYVRLAPDRSAYEKLAAIHLRRKELGKWKATLDEFLTKPDFGLDHKEVQVAIARHLMDEKKWDEALPYAEAAAETWAGDGIAILVNCYEGLKDWEKADLWMSRMVERYPSFYWSDWFFWTMRTGHGDAKAARLAASQYVASLGKTATVDDFFKVGLFHMATGEPRKTIAIYRDLFDKTGGDPAFGIPLAVVAEEVGDTALRDATLDRCTAARAAGTPLHETIKVLRPWLGKEKGEKIDSAALDAALAKLTPQGRGNMCYYVGRLLAARKRPEEAASYFTRAAKMPETGVYMRIFAVAAMRERGVELEYPDEGDPARK